MSGFDIYGLHIARKIVRDVKDVFKGRRASDYVMGYRAALRAVDYRIAEEIERIQTEGKTPS